jgi:hypothetical protein
MKKIRPPQVKKGARGQGEGIKNQERFLRQMQCDRIGIWWPGKRRGSGAEFLMDFWLHRGKDEL